MLGRRFFLSMHAAGSPWCLFMILSIFLCAVKAQSQESKGTQKGQDEVVTLKVPLRLLLAAHPHLLSPVLQIVHRVIATFLIQQAGLQRTEAATGAVTLIQRFGSAATKSPGAILNSRRLAPTG